MVDLRMPKMSGFEVLSQMSLCSTKHVTLAMSAIGGADTRRRVSRLGAKFFPKPFDEAEVLEFLDMVFN